MKRFHCLQHVAFETPGRIEDWIREYDDVLTITRLYNADPFPAMTDFDGLIILGGPMSIHDEAVFPWLAAEKAFIREAVSQNKKIMGICLGAQLLASVLGARVYPNPEKEIGFMPLHFTTAALASPLFVGFPSETVVFHWHGETFDLPPGAIHLAYTNSCINQAFLHSDRFLGLQFHLEVTRELVRDMVAEGEAELVVAPHIHPGEKILLEQGAYEDNRNHLYQLLDRFFM